MRADSPGSSAWTSEKTRYQRGTKSSRLPDSTASAIRSATSSGAITVRRKKALRSTVFCGKPSVSTKPGQHGVHPDAAPCEQAGERARERELGVLRGGVRPGGRERDRAGDRDDVDDVRARLQPGLERAHHPDAAEVVRPQHRLDPLRLEREEVAAPGDAGVVDEQVDTRVALQDRGRGPVDVGALRDVADLVLAAELGRELLEPLLPSRDEHGLPAATRQLPRGRLADAARGAGDDRDPHGRDSTSRRERRAGLPPCGPSRR